MKKRILSFLLVIIMTISIAPTSFATETDNKDSNVVINKTVEGTENPDEYLLTLDAYVKGEAATITKVKPADIVLVLDQSASMYAPMGASGGKDNDKFYTQEELGTNVKQYNENEFKNVYTEDPSTFENNAKQLGYYVAQSKSGGHSYCKSTHPNNDDCKTWDWFVIQYVDGDTHPWKMYRISQTANPSRNSKVVLNDDSVSHTASLVPCSQYNCESGTNKKCSTKGFKNINEMLARSEFVFYKSQYGALYDAISTFSENIIEQNAGHRLAVVGFSAALHYTQYADGSGIYYNSDYKRYNSNSYTSSDYEDFDTVQDIYDADTLDNNDYKIALMSTETNAAGIRASIKAVSSDSYGTNHDAGMDMANKIFAHNPVDLKERDRIVLMFTDGEPSPQSVDAYLKYDGKNYSDHDKGMEASFIDLASKAKKEYGAQVYTIWTSTLSSKRSAFMSYASSDYPEATSRNEGGQKISTPKYASGVKTGEQLMDAFGSVFEDVSSTTTQLNETTVIRDIISQSFTLPNELTSTLDELDDDKKEAFIKQFIKVYEAKYTGNGTFAQPGETGYSEFADAIISITKNSDGLYQVDVSNYDFSKNYVTDLDLGGFVGAKLVIQIPIIVKPDFLGGNNVATNGETSGIYRENGTLVDTFPVPTVDIPLKAITPEFITRNIYIGEQANISHVANVGNFLYGADKTQASVNGINNEYVDIKYIISDKPFINGDTDGETLEFTLTAGTEMDGVHPGTGWIGLLNQNPLLRQDTPYYVMIKVIPITDGDYTETFTHAEQIINVYKPHITFQDSSMDLGQTANYESDDVNNPVTRNYVDVVWKHGDEEANVSEMGPAPTLTYTYNPIQDAFTQDTPVKVTEVVPSETANASDLEHNVPEGQDIIKYATFYRNDCEFTGCEWGENHIDKAIVEHLDATTGELKSDYTNFVVHLNTFDLKITKTGWQEIDENQSFIFEVAGPNNYSAEVVIVGNNSVTIEKLPVGEYTVTEIADWSWRYEPESNNIEISSSNVNNNGVAEVTFNNSRDNEFWLSGDSVVRNWFGIFTNSDN